MVAQGAESILRAAVSAVATAEARSGDGHRDRLGPVLGVGDRVGARRELAEVDEGPDQLGDLDAHLVARPTALPKRDREAVVAALDGDRIEDVAGLDAAAVGDLDDDLAS